MASLTDYPLPIYVSKINMDDYRIVKSLCTDTGMELAVVEPKEDPGREYIMHIARRPLLDRNDQFRWATEIREFDAHIDEIRKDLKGLKEQRADNLIKIHEYGLENHTYQVIVYECDEGILLSQELGQPREHVDILKAVRRARIIARTLHDLHRRETYLNVNPSNILIGKNQQVCLLCFRNSVESGPKALLYLASENAGNGTLGEPGPTADQYALAIMLCQMISGEVPFQGQGALTVVPQHINNEPILSKKIPFRLRPVLLRALAKRPEERFQSMEEFATSLAQAARRLRRITLNQWLVKRLPIRPYATTHISSRRKLLAGGIIALAALAIGGSVFASLRRSSTTFPKTSRTPGSTTAQPEPTEVQPFTLAYHYDHAEAVNVAAWSPDGKFCASGDDAGFVQVHDISLQTIILTYIEHYKHAVVSLAWYPKITSDYYVASIGADGWLKIWNIYGSTLAAKKFSGDDFTLAWTPNGEHLLIGVDETVQCYDDPVTYQFSRPDDTYKGHSAPITAIATTPGNNRLVATASWDKTVQLWDAETPCNKDGSPHSILTLKHTQGVTCVSFSPDANLIASAGEDHQVLLWYTDNGLDRGSIRLSIDDHEAPVNTVAWHPDGKHLASGGTDKMVYVFDLDKKPIFNFQLTDVVQTVAWSPDRQHLAASGMGRTVQIWKAI